MYTWFLISIGIVINTSAEQVMITHAEKQMVGVRIAYTGSVAHHYADIIASDIEVSGQFTVQQSAYTEPPKKRREITDLVHAGIFFLLILESHDKNLEYRLYDTTTGKMLPKGSGRCVMHRATERVQAHHIADQVWYLLTGQGSMFNTHIAYAKEVPYRKNITVKHICVASHDGCEERVMVSAPTISIAPRWGGTADEPLIFYSEYTNTNVRLMGVNEQRRRKVVTRYDGVSMHFTQNHDGSMHVFASSRGDGNSQIYLLRNGVLEQCTHDDAMNVCPTFNHDGSLIYYCSDVNTGLPHIMQYNRVNNIRESLPIAGYCLTPAYNNTRKLVAYSKMIDGFMQICVYDPATQKERQLTHDAGNHEDPTWSPDGNFLAYAHELKQMSRIRVHCYATGYERYITPAEVRCSYPAWSLY